MNKIYIPVKNNTGDIMIKDYKIVKENNEEILYLYLDISVEFAKIEINKKSNNLEKTIKEFIKKNKIAFTGTTIALVVGGIVIGNIHFKNIDIAKTIKNTPQVEEKLNVNSEVDAKKDETEEEYTEDESDDIKIATNTSSEKTNDSSKSGSSSKVSASPSTGADIEINNTAPSIPASSDSFEEPTPDTNTYVSIRRSNGSVITLELDEYVIGVVGAEMPAAFHDEALKAQAVIARTYALQAISRGQTLTDSNSTQNYKSNEELINLWGGSYDTYYNKIRNAVLTTSGQYLSYNGSYIEAVYHSTSNGTTEASVNVWGNYFPYLVSVESPYDTSNPSFVVEKQISYAEVSSKLQTEVNIDTNFNILGKTSGNRVESIEINGKVFKGTDFRNLLSLRSSDFDIIKNTDSVIFKTRGYGHGVGMSQYGANGMAKNGYSYIQILNHYYPGVSLSYK